MRPGHGLHAAGKRLGQAHGVGLGKVDEGRLDAEVPHAHGLVDGQLLGADERLPAVGIVGVVLLVDLAVKHVCGDDVGSQGQEEGVAHGHEGRLDALAYGAVHALEVVVLRKGRALVEQRGGAAQEASHVDHLVAGYAGKGHYLARALDLDGVRLAVVEGHGVDLCVALPGPEKAGGGVLSAGKHDDAGSISFGLHDWLFLLRGPRQACRPFCG